MRVGRVRCRRTVLILALGAGALDFRTRPHFRPVILNPTTGEVVSTW